MNTSKRKDRRFWNTWNRAAAIGTGLSPKTFHLGDVLSVVTGRLLCPDGVDGLYRILGHMTGQEVYTHQLPRFAEACRPALSKQFPQLVGLVFALGELDLLLERAEKYEKQAICQDWVTRVSRGHFGNRPTPLQLTISPLRKQPQRVNPLKELFEMVSAA